VDGVCDPLHAFGPGDFGPSGEDVTDRLVLAGVFHVPAGFELSMLGQAETGHPITLTTPVDVNGFGDTLDDRAVVNGVQTTLDEFRGTPYIQFDMRVARPVRINERWSLMPFIEFFNLFNRNNPGANYVTNIAALPNTIPTPQQLANLTELCSNPACTETTPASSKSWCRRARWAISSGREPRSGFPLPLKLGSGQTSELWTVRRTRGVNGRTAASGLAWPGETLAPARRIELFTSGLPLHGGPSNSDSLTAALAELSPGTPARRRAENMAPLAGTTSAKALKPKGRRMSS
jgi:hypothetical protein